MYWKHGAYYHVSAGGGQKQKWTRLAVDYSEALRAYAELEGRGIPLEFDPGWEKTLYERVKRGAQQRRISFTLTREQFADLVEHSGHRCAVTGIPFELSPRPGVKSPWAPSLDRIDSNLGYSFDNCRLVCMAVNYALNEWGTDGRLRIADGIRETTKGRRR